MGFFTRLFGKSDADSEDEAHPEGEIAGPGLPTTEEWEEMDSEAQFAWIVGELRTFASDCEQVGMRVADDHYECELRGVYGAHPIRIELDDDGGAEVVVSFVNRRGHFCLIPDRGETIGGDFQSAPTDIVKIAVAPGVALHALPVYVADDRETWEGLPPALRNRLVERAAREGRVLNVRHQSVTTHVRVGPHAKIGVADGLRRELEQLFDLTEHLSQGPEPIPARSSTVVGDSIQAIETVWVSCRYCTTRFSVEQDDPRCPSCGAPDP